MQNISFKNIGYSGKYIQKTELKWRYSEKLSRQNILRQLAKAPCENSSSPKEGKLRPRLKPEKYLFISLNCFFSALTIILMMIIFCDYCLQTFLSTSTVSFAPLLLNIASISSCPYLRDNVWIKSSRLYFVFCIFLYFIFCKLKCSCHLIASLRGVTFL